MCYGWLGVMSAFSTQSATKIYEVSRIYKKTSNQSSAKQSCELKTAALIYDNPPVSRENNIWVRSVAFAAAPETNNIRGAALFIVVASASRITFMIESVSLKTNKPAAFLITPARVCFAVAPPAVLFYLHKAATRSETCDGQEEESNRTNTDLPGWRSGFSARN